MSGFAFVQVAKASRALGPAGLRPRLRRSGFRGGAVMIVALLGLVLLAAMVFYIFNVGNHVAKRVETQNAADNAAISGARWMARSFNTVAMNNVESARLIALANVMDSIPQSVDYTLIDTQSILQSMDAQRVRGMGADSAWLDGGMDLAYDTFTRQQELLEPMDEFLNNSGYDIARMTHYRGTNDARGDIWQAIESLAALSQATMDNVGVLAQYSAFRGAQISQRESGKSSGGIMLPWRSDIPWEPGAFDEFRSPVIDGLLDGDQDDKVNNRGPFDTIFGFRQIRSTAERRSLEIEVELEYANPWVPPPPSEEIISREPFGYSTYGAYLDVRQNAMSLGVGPAGISGRYQEALLDPADAADHPLVPSLWARRVAFMSDQKINGAFPGSAAARIVREPIWVTDYDTAVAMEEAGEPEIAYGLYLLFTYYRDEYTGIPPKEPILETWGLVRPERNVLNPPNLAKVGEHIWRDDRVERYVDSVGTSYGRRFIRYYVFLGVNIGPEAEVRNPNNFTNLQRGSMPGPVTFPIGQFGPDETNRRDNLTFLGIAHQPKEAKFWPEGFDGDRPDRLMVGLAQAEVFNNHSWDLWTQMWHAQLTPVNGLDQWMDELEDPQGVGQMPWLLESDVSEVTSYLQAAQPLMNLMLEAE